MIIKISDTPGFIFLFFLITLTGCVEREDTILIPPDVIKLVELSGKISGKLTLKDSPYIIVDDIRIDASDELIIEPGVRLYFNKNKGLTVHGNLFVKGSKERRIIFSSDSIWSGIKIVSSDSTSIQYCLIENALSVSDTTENFSAITADNSSISIMNSEIKNNVMLYGGGIFLESCEAEISNNILRDNYAAYFGGAIYSTRSNLKIINNTFFENECENFGGGIVLVNNSEIIIQNNIFHKNRSRTGSHTIDFPASDSINNIIQYNFITIGNSDPAFISEDDLHLQVWSQCKDAGNPDQLYNDFDNSRNDQGAFGGPLGNW